MRRANYLFFLTEDLSVLSNLDSITLILCSNISVKAAVNSICLRTCVSFFLRSFVYLTLETVQSNKLFSLPGNLKLISTPFPFACHYIKNLIAVAGAKYKESLALKQYFTLFFNLF
jgi:hypothetical protein